MLILPLKAPTYFDLQTSLADWLDGDQEVSLQTPHSSDEPPLVFPKPPFKSQQCRAELLRINALRKCLSESILKPNSHKAALEDQALEDLCEYHAALLEFEQRGFPTIDDENNGLKLTWKSAFAPQKETHHTLVWDRACCLWNVAALYSQLITSQPDNRDGYKQAITYCQTAAALLHILKELATASSGDDFATTVELAKPMLSFWEQLFVAHAQSMIYKIADPTKHSILSGISASAHQLYNEALHSAQDPRLQSEVPKFAKEWGAYCKGHSMMASAKAEYHQAVLHRSQQTWGHELARLKLCLQKLEKCQEFVNAADDDNPSLVELKREVDAYLPFVANRYKAAYSDNVTVYQDEIPSYKLEDIEPKQLAKRNPTGLPASMKTPKVPLFTKL